MKKVYPLLLILLYPALAFLQPVPCLEDPPEMTSLCADACIICDIDGFTGRHDSAVPGVAPVDFCTIVVHNAQWIAFIAGSEDLVVEIAVSNCQLGFGLEVGLYEGIDCTNFRRVSNCEGGTNTPIGPGTQSVLSNSEPLVIGQYYYVVMDGAFGDNCDWTISVLQGSTAVAPLTAAPLIEGPGQVCPELLATYNTPGVVGGNELLWTLNGLEIGTADSIVIGWPGAGIYELCLSISNVCDQAPISCRSIVVASLLPTVFNETICAGDCFVLHDSLELCEEGFFEFNFPSTAGCDSIVMVNLTVFESDETSLAATICEGDTLIVGGIPFFNQGTYTTVLQNTLGCDSTVVLELELIVCEIQGQAQEVPVVCRGEASGQITFFVINGTAPFNYSWQRLGGVGTGSGMLGGTNMTETLSGLVAGTYLITINDDFGNDLVLIQEVTEPERLTAELLASNYNGFNLTCENSADGTLNVQAQGGVTPYTYAWDNGTANAEISALAAGGYTVQITDAVGCSLTQSATLTEPLPLALTAIFTDADCGGDDTGEIRVLEASGGVSPYLFSLNDGPLSGEQVFFNLTGGDYTLRMEDANGCTVETSGSLQTRIIPVLSLPADTSLELAEEYTLRPIANVPLDMVLWQPATGLSCTDCPYPTLTATETTVYTLAVTSVDGCTTVDSVLITVLDVRDVFVPNVFSPNKDGVNDELIVFGGPEVVRIRSFRVFNRWGDLVYETTGLLPNSNDQAWDGRFDGKELGNEVFVWSAEIEFIDGKVLDYGGDVLLLR
jgi:gliding motility-associated-like protein